MATPVGTLKQFSGNTYRWDGTGWQYVEPSLNVGGSGDDPSVINEPVVTSGGIVQPITTSGDDDLTSVLGSDPVVPIDMSAGGDLGLVDQGASNMAPGTWDDWSPVFGEYSPEQQYTSLMSTAMPNYYTPRYGQMAQRQFAPTFGRYLLGGYGGGTTGLGTGAGFADWYEGQGLPAGQAPTGGVGIPDISGGYNQALAMGQAGVGSESWDTMAASNPGMAYAMQDPQAVQAMALARYYGGGGPVGGYAGRAVQNTLGSLYDRYMTRGAQSGITGPAGYLGYLGGLGGNKFGAMTT
jgi:hypothetical protein